jgi:hypothetical protein
MPFTKEEWLDYLVDVRAVPVWAEQVAGNVYFRSIEQSRYAGRRLFGRGTRQYVANILGIVSKADCERVSATIKQRINRT